MATAASLLLVVFHVVLVSVKPAQQTNKGASRPHIVFLFIDDLGWNDVGYHGSVIKTPNIDSLAADGVKLENYYTQPLCTPSRAALMTGRYPFNTGMQHFALVVDEPWGLPLELKTLPEGLQKLGYKTHLVGKWHLGFYKCEHTPPYRGFDSFFGYYPALEDHFNHTRLGINALYNHKTPDTSYVGSYSTSLYTQRSIAIINEHESSSSERLFLFLSYSAVHTPLQAPQSVVDKYSFINDTNRRIYAAMTDELDRNIGLLVQALKSKGMWNNTLLIFAADNGGMPGWGGASNYPLRGIKTTLWEGGVKGVAFVHGEMLEMKGTTSKELIHVTDWYPTLLDLAGGEMKHCIDGVNVWRTIQKGGPSPRNEIVLNIDVPRSAQQEEETSFGLGTYSGAAIRRKDMKLMVRAAGSSWYGRPEDGAVVPSAQQILDDRLPFVELALYNITADPEERHDLKHQYPQLVQFLKRRLNSYYPAKPLNRKSSREANRLAQANGYWGPWVGRVTCCERPSPRPLPLPEI